MLLLIWGVAGLLLGTFVRRQSVALLLGAVVWAISMATIAARAGYSFPAPGEVTTVGPLLHKGLGRLHFAGEHTCYAFFGYMEGALQSGVSLARKLARRDGLHK